METKTKFRKLESFTKKEQEIIEKKNWELTDDYFKALADAGGLSPLSCGLHRLMYMIWVNTGLIKVFVDERNKNVNKSVTYQFVKYSPENNKLKK